MDGTDGATRSQSSIRSDILYRYSSQDDGSAILLGDGGQQWGDNSTSATPKEVPWYWSCNTLSEADEDAPSQQPSWGNVSLGELDVGTLATMLISEQQARRRAEARAKSLGNEKQAVETQLLTAERHVSELQQQLDRSKSMREKLMSEKLTLEASLMDSDTEKMALEKALLSCSEQLASAQQELIKLQRQGKYLSCCDRGTDAAATITYKAPSTKRASQADATSPERQPLLPPSDREPTPDASIDPALYAADIQSLTEQLANCKLQLAESQAREAELSKKRRALQQLNEELAAKLQDAMDTMADLIMERDDHREFSTLEAKRRPRSRGGDDAAEIGSAAVAVEAARRAKAMAVVEARVDPDVFTLPGDAGGGVGVGARETVADAPVAEELLQAVMGLNPGYKFAGSVLSYGDK